MLSYISILKYSVSKCSSANTKVNPKPNQKLAIDEAIWMYSTQGHWESLKLKEFDPLVTLERSCGGYDWSVNQESAVFQTAECQNTECNQKT
jgi:hypothetical protein